MNIAILLQYFVKSRVFIESKNTIDQQSKDSINTLQNSNFIEIMKHINSYWVENIPDMDPELLPTICLPNLQGMRSKKR